MTEDLFPYQKVRFIAKTEPRPDLIAGAGFDHGKMTAPTASDLIAYCARVSNPANQDKFDTAGKLLKYLTKNEHWSPFEMAHMVVEVQTTRDIGRQILRHRSFSFQEFSQRYAEVSEDWFISVREARLQDTKNRQNSVDTTESAEDTSTKSLFKNDQEEHISDCIGKYRSALENGIAKEQARCFLPEGLTMSRMYMSGTVRSWIHYCMVRETTGITQKEHVDIARKCRKILVAEFPSLKDLFDAKSDVTQKE